MRPIYSICCGLDVHKRSVTACLLTFGASGEPCQEKRTFGTTTNSLLQLADWLVANGCRHVAMESTGVYWRPVFNLLEGVCEVLLVNSQHMKQVPCRKTDARDAAWIAELLAHGLLRGSFIPPVEIRDLRELTRYRVKLVQQRADQCNRIQKLLEGANLKLASFVTDILGVSGRNMLEALAAGETDVDRLSEMAKGRMRRKIPQLREALRGVLTDTQRWLLREQLDHVSDLDRRIGGLTEKIGELCAPFRQKVEQLTTIPGVSVRMAENVIAEIGVDMSRFGSAKHLASWAGMCPGQNESGGRQKSGRRGKGSHWLRAALTEAGWAASHTKDNYLAAQFRNISRRRGARRACVALGHTILCTIYHLLKNPDATFRDLGADYFDKRHKSNLVNHLIQRLAKLGLKVTISPAA